MKMYKNGLKVKGLIEELKKLPQDSDIYVACDEEQNTLFSGYYLEENVGYVVIAGLSTTEVE